MEPSAAAGPVEDGLKPAAEPMEQVRPAEEQQKKPSTLPPLPTPQDDGSAAAAAAANVAEDELQDTILEPAAPADAVGQDKSVTDNGATAREEQNWTPIPTASTTTTTPVPHTPATPTGKPRPILQGTLIGLFVAIDPAMQRGKVNVKRELEFMGIYQRDLAPKEEVQLSLEQAFYLASDLKRLEVYLPAPPPPFQQQEEQQQQQQQQQVEEEEGQEGQAMDQGNGEAEQPQQQQKQEGAVSSKQKEDAEPKALSVVECWKAFRTASSTFVKSVGSYRYFRGQGFVVHGGLNLGLDYMLYRGTPQRYHAEFGVLLRYPPSFPPSSSSEEGGGEGGGGGGGGEGGKDENGLGWRDLHLLYRLIGEVRKTLILGHVRLGKLEEEEDKAEVKKEEGEEEGREEEEEDLETRLEMQQWYSGLRIYEVAITPWRAGTPLARLKMSKQKGNAAQVKRGVGQAGGKKRGRGGGGGGEGGGGGVRGSGAEEEEHPSKRHHI